MVRVISVHHFLGQHIQTVEQPTACTIAPPDRFLLALTSNCIEVRDLKNESELLFSFPSVDEVIQIVHCRNGNYVATMETKFNRQNKETNFVRVYINWDSVATLQQSKMTSSGISLGSSECGMVQPMRARIAGRVTPTTNQSELGSLEMIEIPVKRNPDLVQCCQVSGNLVILAGKLLTFYTFQVKTHDISKMKFIDFEEIGMMVEMPFLANTIEFCENYIAALNKDCMYLFKIVASGREGATDATGATDNFDFKNCHDDAVDYRKLIKDESLNLIKTKITVNLPSIIRDNSIIHKHSPFTFTDKDMTATILSKTNTNNNNNNSNNNNYEIKNLIQLKLIPILVESAQRQITEEFKAIILKPLYINESLNRNMDLTNLTNRIFLQSDYNNCLNSLMCMIATQQEGYLYFFNNNSDFNYNSDNCIAVYPFTAPVHQLVMEDYFLHALTETGLESYTLRYGHKLCRNFEVVDDINVACPSVTDSICLVGLRPFLGVEQILIADNNLVLLANSETSPTHSVSSNSSSNAAYWTLYNLELPPPKTIFNDISIVANVHRFTSVQTYCHLMSEAHIILRVALILRQWTCTEDTVKLILAKKWNNDDIVETYRVSCALLADHYIMCPNEEDYTLAIPYYKMARILPVEVLRRVRKIQEQSNNHGTKGLMNYLKTILLEIKYSWEADKVFSGGTKQNFADAILELLEHHNYEDLPNLILKSSILREYSTDRLIQILSQKLKNHPEKVLALAVLWVQKCNVIKAQECLERICKEDLQKILFDNWELLFDTSQSFQNRSKSVVTFSELATILIATYPDILAEIFVCLITERKALSLNKIIKVFLEYLPSSIGSDSSSASILLQKTLEMYFQQFLARVGNTDPQKIGFERGTNEAIKLLIRSYLSQLQILQLKEDTGKSDEMTSSLSKIEGEIMGSDNEDKSRPYFDDKIDKNEPFLFSHQRFSYLDKMPPFQVEITSKLYQICLPDYVPKYSHKSNDEADFILKKLQAILCTNLVPKQVISEVNGFVTINDSLRGNLSLQSIILGNNDAVLLLIDACPQCLLQFGKDRFGRTDEWKFLIATVQRRILKLSQCDVLKRICFFHKKILNDILTYVATSMTLDQLIQVFPQRFSSSSSSNGSGAASVTTSLSLSLTIDNDSGDNNKINLEKLYECDLSLNLDSELDLLNEIQNYEPYVVICKESMHANQINKLITTTAQQLLCTLNL